MSKQQDKFFYLAFPVSLKEEVISIIDLGCQAIEALPDTEEWSENEKAAIKYCAFHKWEEQTP